MQHTSFTVSLWVVRTSADFRKNGPKTTFEAAKTLSSADLLPSANAGQLL
jgi:hypothetical protein